MRIGVVPAPAYSFNFEPTSAPINPSYQKQEGHNLLKLWPSDSHLIVFSTNAVGFGLFCSGLDGFTEPSLRFNLLQSRVQRRFLSYSTKHRRNEISYVVSTTPSRATVSCMPELAQQQPQASTPLKFLIADRRPSLSIWTVGHPMHP